MIKLLYSPRWFVGTDMVIDIIGALVLFFIAFFSIRSYRLLRNKNYLRLANSFFLIGLSYLFKIMANYTLYYPVLETKQIGLVTLTLQTVKASDALFFIGYFFYRLLTLLGLYLLYSLYTKPTKSDNFLILYLILISTYFSSSAYIVFHFTALLFFWFITQQYYFNCRKNPSTASRLLFRGFVVLTASNVLFIFIGINRNFYALAEIIQLIGYIFLLVAYILVRRHGKTNTD